MKSYKCLLCNKKMVCDNDNKVISSSDLVKDYFCRSSDHFFAKRFIKNNVTKIKFRLQDHDGSYLYSRINYDECNTEIWKTDSKKFKIDSVTDFDFSDHEKLLKKLKTYLIFY